MYISIIFLYHVTIKVWCAKQEFGDGNSVSNPELAAFLTEV